MNQSTTCSSFNLAACSAELKEGVLTLSTGRLERRYRWNGGALIGDHLVDLRTGATWSLEAEGPDLDIPHHDVEPEAALLEVEQVASDSVETAHLKAVVTVRLNTLEVRRTFRLYPNCPAIACDLELRGRARGPWRGAAAKSADQANIESIEDANHRRFLAPVTERLPLHRHHTRLTCVELRDVTDRHNNLVHNNVNVPWARTELARGNLFLVKPLLEPGGVFLLKEAPNPDAQIAYPGYDVRFDHQTLQLVGLGLDPEDLLEDEWTQGYSTVIGMARDEAEMLRALRDYQHRQRAHRPHRDELVLVNTWGDRSKDSRINEQFILRELETCARLGASHLQIDDGWQRGSTSHSATTVGTLDQVWARDGWWDVHPERFPSGLKPVVQRARELGVEVALWYVPSPTDDGWENDATRIIELWRDLGVRTFKIDMYRIPDKLADRRLRATLDRVQKESAGQVIFNLDATAGQRLGYFDGTRYGLVFLENRYTDWANYYPHWTLRNLWQLAHYVPPQRFQIEWLNTWRNTDNYRQDDPLAPSQVGFEYAFAVTMAAQPLGWFESCNLPETAFEIAPLVKAYRQHQAAIHTSPVLPIGEEPTGTAWSGFQSLGENGGYLLIYRELNNRPEACLTTWLPPDTSIAAVPVIGHGEPFEATADETGKLRFALDRAMSWCLYQYEVR